jgi:phage repressor protein C with HTH and peptisase S24 domain
MNKYERVLKELETAGTAQMKVFGNSMTPILKSGSLMTYKREDDYEVGQIVFCKVKGRYIDAHLITKKDKNKGFMISNNHNWDNGWTKTIYGRVTRAEHGQEIKDF